jgi:hypothetical protein
MTDSTAKTFTDSVRIFLDSATWLDDSHAPSVIALQAVARELDFEVTGALVAQFGLLHRSLLKAKPEAPTFVDPLGELLRRDV